MDLTGASFLYTLAALMITFAGFSALLLGIRQAAGIQPSPLDRYLAKTALTQLFTLAAGALLPPLLSFPRRGSGVSPPLFLLCLC